MMVPMIGHVSIGQMSLKDQECWSFIHLDYNQVPFPPWHLLPNQETTLYFLVGSYMVSDKIAQKETE